jgi:predicted nucleic acid-binding protein
MKNPTKQELKNTALKIFFDVNIVLELAIKKMETPNNNIFILNLIEDRKITPFVTTGVIQTSSYFLLKYLKYEKTKEVLEILLPNFEFLEGKKTHVTDALKMNHIDIENAIFYQIALAHEMDAILTSDKDFLKLSKPYLSLITPEELKERIEN